MRTISYSIIFLLIGWCLTVSKVQAKEPPDHLLKRVTQELIVELREKQAVVQNEPTYVYKLVDKILVPYVDWVAMAQWVVGRNAWMQASSQQRTRFAEEFKDLLIRTYATTLKAYKNQTIDYLPIRGGVEGKNRVQINSFIREPGRNPIRVSYRLIEKEDSWKVYDISIEGVSLLKGFQAQFASEIRQSGLDTLIQRLHQHNEKPLR